MGDGGRQAADSGEGGGGGGRMRYAVEPYGGGRLSHIQICCR